MRTAGMQSLSVGDASAGLTQSSIIQVAAAAPTQLRMTANATTLTAGVPTTLLVQATDSLGNVTADFNQSIVFSSSDPNAALPAPYMFQPGDAGIATFTSALSFAHAGTQTVEVDAVGTSLQNAALTFEIAPPPQEISW